MGKLHFNGNDSKTIGVEIELALVDANTFALANRSGDLISRLPPEFAGQYKPELMQNCVEINTGVCDTVAQVRQDLTAKAKVLESTADALGMRLWWGSTHPFSHWRDQVITPTERYQNLVVLLQEMARRMATFGLHVHIGVDSGDKAVMICDRIMQHLPTLLALSCSSPYWEDRDTGLHSQRSKIMEGLPTAGLPTLMRNWSEYVWLVNHMIETGFINSIREIWWDVRPHHNFGTVEVRVCDMPGSMDDVCALSALIQCLVKQLSDEIDEGTYQFDCHPMMVQQNKWRAARYGIDAGLVNTYSYEVQPVKEVADSLAEWLKPIAQELGCEDELAEISRIARGPSWAQRQRDLLELRGDKAEVVRELTDRSRLI
ncbi:carboxylate-amine ligase [Rosistilla oblonga]|uniref:carboxylate-amine ligase n=1 Tax=Rosistilla oblonga TaxID=2527990 RepID=UPI003A970BC6